MNRPSRSALLLLGPVVTALLLFGACSSSPQESAAGSTTTGGVTPDGGTGGAGGAIPDAGPMETGADTGSPDAGSAACTALGLTSRPFVTSGTGPHRGDLAGDFTLALSDGTSFTFSTEAIGCETYVFLPDILTVTQTNTESIWDHDLAALVKASPKNAHYFFVSLKSSDAAAKTSTDAMQGRVTTLLGTLSTADAAVWKDHLHVVSTRGQDIAGWFGTALKGWGQQGFAIDRRQRLRGVGFLSDVTRQVPNPPANSWPFESNLAYAANEAIYMNAESDELDRLDAESATVVPVFTGQVLQGEGFADVAMPSAAQLAGFDTLEVEVTMQCPDNTALEFNSCGAWDYIAQLSLDTPDADAGVPDSGDAGPPMTETELGRFITSYHRETHWVEDITPMMTLLSGPGTKHLHYAYAPSWNVQPTGVTMSLRFSNQKKGYSPATIAPIAAGGTFNDKYNLAYMPVNVPIPADTKRSEVWMIVTGHGSDSHQCGEFCNSEHQFTINGDQNSWMVKFPMAGTETGCIKEQKNGMVPNQGGTWWYGRDGWCPGEEVAPHVWDVTALATPGSTAVVTYEGLFNGKTPPADGMGNIVLSSYVVTYH